MNLPLSKNPTREELLSFPFCDYCTEMRMCGLCEKEACEKLGTPKAEMNEDLKDYPCGDIRYAQKWEILKQIYNI